MTSVIAVVENDAGALPNFRPVVAFVVLRSDPEKLNMLRVALGQSILEQQSASVSGSHSHRIVLFIVEYVNVAAPAGLSFIYLRQILFQ